MRFQWALLWRERRIVSLGMLVLGPMLCVEGISGWRLWGSILFLAAMLCISAMDCRYGLIFDRLLLPLGAVGLCLDFLGLLVSPWDGLLGAAAGFLSLFLVRWGSRGGMGGGDVKYAAVLGLWLGWKLLLLALFLAFLAGSLAALGVVVCCRIRRDRIPFGPFLSLGAWTALLWGASLFRWYEGIWP